MSVIDPELHLLLKGTRTAMSFVAEARRLALTHPFPETGQPGYSVMADVLARAVLFADWEVVGAAALVRAGSVIRVVELGLRPPFRSDEFARRLTWRMIADASHELAGIAQIEDAHGGRLEVSGFVARRRASRAVERAARPVPVGRITIPRAGSIATMSSLGTADRARPMPRAPHGVAF